MSPSLLAMLLRCERTVQRWRATDYFTLLADGYTPAQARYYCARSNWPDAVTLQRMDHWQY